MSRRIVLVLLAVVLTLGFAQAAGARAPLTYPVTSTTFTFVDTTRATPRNGTFPGAPTRTIPTLVLSPSGPAAHGHKFPLIVFSPGFTATGPDYAPNKSSPNTVASAPVTTTAAKAPADARKKKAAPRFARLKLQPTGSVWVCVLAAGARKLEPGVVIGPTDTLPTWRSSRFVMTFGNGDLTMRVNGRTLAVPAVSKPIGYEITRSGKRHVLPASQQPTCS